MYSVIKNKNLEKTHVQVMVFCFFLIFFREHASLDRLQFVVGALSLILYKGILYQEFVMQFIFKGSILPVERL